MTDTSAFPADASEKPNSWKPIVAGAVIVLFGVVWIAITAVREERSLADKPLRDAAIVVMDEAPVVGGISVRLRPVPLDNYGPSPVLDEILASESVTPSMRDAIRYQRERFYLIPADAAPWESALESGRIPVPGQPEVLGGALTKLDRIVMDGTTFEVTGRLSRPASGFTTGYVLPEAPEWRPYFESGKEGEQAWLYASMADSTDEERESLTSATVVYGGITPSEPAVVWQLLAALLLIAGGGAMAQIVLLQNLAAWRIPGMQTLLTEYKNRPRLAWALTCWFFGTFFCAMVIGVSSPAGVMQATSVVRSIFADGDLSYIGEAYESGHVFRAAFATWIQNFLVATVVMTLAASVVLPFFAVFKNTLTFFLVGYALAPLWTGSADGYVYHSVTMTLELQAYVFAAFAAVLFPVVLLERNVEQSISQRLYRGAAIMGGATILAGVQLGVAALYEAVTLIALHRT